jgi:hypothetical protein
MAKTDIMRALLSPQQLSRSLQQLDHAALGMIAVVWLAAVTITGMALYTVNKSYHKGTKVDEAAALEPIVPQMEQARLARPEIGKLSERLKARFEKVTFNATADNQLEIVTSDPNAYEEWLSAIGYLDALVPQVRWSIREMCVGGECGGNSLMKALIMGERVNFKIPEPPPPPAEEEKK